MEEREKLRREIRSLMWAVISQMVWAKLRWWFWLWPAWASWHYPRALRDWWMVRTGKIKPLVLTEEQSAVLAAALMDWEPRPCDVKVVHRDGTVESWPEYQRRKHKEESDEFLKSL